MASFKRQLSWQEDFPRNFFRLFSRVKSVEQDTTELETENCEEPTDAIVTSQSSESDSLPSPDQYLNMTPGAQTVGYLEQDRLVEGNRACDHEGSEQGDAECDPSSITPPASEPCSPLPPVDSFFRRLGSLFLFARAEPGGAGRTVPPSEEVQGEKDIQTLASLDEGELTQQLEPQKVFQFTAGPDTKATTEEDLQNPQLQEEDCDEEEGTGPLKSQSVVEDEERVRALACPPVVTHVTYRGLKKIRKMKRNQEVRLHSPISEGEEGQRESGLNLSSSQVEEMEQCEANTTVPVVAAPIENHSGPKTFPDTDGSVCQSHPVVGSSVLSRTCFVVEAEGTDSDLSPSALRTHTKATKKSVDIESDPMTIPNISSVNENGACRFENLEQFTSQSLKLDHDQTTAHVLVFPVSTETLETPKQQLSNANTTTISHSHLTDIYTPSSLPSHVIGLETTSDCFQDSQLSRPGPYGSDNEEIQAIESSLSPDSSGHMEDRTTQLGLSEQQLGLDIETLQLESQKLVDNILTNALAALEKVDISKQGHETLSSDKCNGDSGNHIFLETKDIINGSSRLGRSFSEHLHVQGDENSQSTLSDGILGSRMQADGSRSTPSSGYESIAGSDNDIQSSMSMNADLTSASGLIGIHELQEDTGIKCCTEGKSVSQSRKQESQSHTTFLLGLNYKENGGSARTDPDNELLHKYALSDSNISHISNITSVKPATSAFICGVNKGHVQCVLEDNGVHGCVLQRKTDADLEKVAKDNTESNNLRHAYSSGDVSPVINYTKASGQAEPGSQVEVRNLDSKQLADDVAEMGDKPDLSLVQCHAFDEPIDSHFVSYDSLKKPELVSQGSESGVIQRLANCESTQEPRVVPLEGLLASVVDDGPENEMQDEAKVPSCPQHNQSLSLDTCDSSIDDSQCFRAVKVFLCNVTDDDDDDIQEDNSPILDSVKGLSLERPVGRLAARPHLDLPGSFAIISEEEETDTVFVNDTGPMLSPSTRRVKIYPFSLSPIYEEDSGREAISRDDVLHVPPATEEEQRSVEQQSSSILSLLQSVSEKLQLATFSDCEMKQDEERGPNEPEHPQHFLRPLWDRYENAGPERESNLLDQKFTGIDLLNQEHTKYEGASPSLIPNLRMSGTQDEEFGENQCKMALSSVVKAANSPFYEYLRSSTVPDTQGSKNDLCNIEAIPALTSVREMGGFGKVCERPTLLYIYKDPTLSGERREVFGDVDDARGIIFPQEATIKARRGCWLLYVEPGYRGSCILLDEGQTIQTSGETRDRDGPSTSATVSVGSIRRAVKDDTCPEICLYSASTEKREPVCFHTEVDHIDALGPVQLSDLSVRSGCWVAYDDTGFRGNQTVLEVGGRTTPILQKSPVSCVRSLRPIRMEGLRVLRPLDPKMLVYEKPLFQGQCQELVENTPSLVADKGAVQVSSLRVCGGVWVGYSCENYRGQQYLLEEGEYSDCNMLKSFRFLLADFVEPVVSLSTCGEQMELVDQDVADMQQTGLVNELNSIDVINGVWVAYSGRVYTGDQYVLEKGHHSGILEWGGRKSSPLSIRPVRREISGEKKPNFLLRVYSEPRFAGESRVFESEASDCGMLDPASFRVILGSWLLYDEEGFCGNQFVLGEGLYPTIASCGCMATAIRSFKPIQYNLSKPSISLFSLGSFQGLETETDSPIEDMDNFFTQSLRVNSGLWVAYEFGHFKGRQMLLQMGEYPCWADFTSWDTIGSLQPLRQRQVYVQVQSRALGMALTVETTGQLSTTAKLTMSPADQSLRTQHWLYTQALLKSKVGKGCLTVIGGKACAGTRVALWEEHGRLNQRWSLNENGTISSCLNHSLVMDRKGGSGRDKDYLILNEFCPDSATQFWDINVL